MALSMAKEAGGNVVRLLTHDMRSAVIERTRLERELHNALAQQGELTLHYQPQFNTRTRRIDAVEALVRWNHPERGQLSPSEFVPVAERSDLIRRLGLWVVAEALRQGQAWADAGHPMRISVNISPAEFLQGDAEAALHKVQAMLAEDNLDPKNLELEITEGVFMDAANRALLDDLAGSGMGLAIDDFGTGYSSLAYLKDFKARFVKIDIRFVRGLPGDGTDAALTKTIIRLAHGLGMATIAEGVENAEQARFLIDNACDYLQGYFVSHPVPPEELVEIVGRQNRPDSALRNLFVEDEGGVEIETEDA